MINHKALGKSFNNAEWCYYWFDGKFYHYKKELKNGQYAVIKLIKEDFSDDSYKFMFEHSLTR